MPTQFDLYLKWCEDELLDPYSMKAYRKFYSADAVYENPSTGTIVISDDVSFTESGLPYDNRSTDEPQEYLEEVEIG